MISKIVLALIGLFLIFDSLFIHAISLNYDAYFIGFLDSFISHGILGLIFVIIAIIDFQFLKGTWMELIKMNWKLNGILVLMAVMILLSGCTVPTYWGD